MVSNEYFYIGVVRETLPQPVPIDHVIGNTAGNALRAAVHHEGILWDEKCPVLLCSQQGHFAFWGVLGRGSPDLLPSDTESLVQQVKPLRVCRVVKG